MGKNDWRVVDSEARKWIATRYCMTIEAMRECYGEGNCEMLNYEAFDSRPNGTLEKDARTPSAPFHVNVNVRSPQS